MGRVTDYFSSFTWLINKWVHQGEGESTDLNTELELTEALNERHALDVAHSATQFYDAHLGLDVVLDRLLGHSLHPFLDGVRYMGNDCNFSSQFNSRFNSLNSVA